MNWIYLTLAIAFEVTGTTMMKLSEGFTKLTPSILVFVFYAISIVTLVMALKEIDIAVAYAIWSGVGTASIAIIGMFVFKEPATTFKMLSLALIIIGVVGLNLATK